MFPTDIQYQYRIGTSLIAYLEVFYASDISASFRTVTRVLVCVTSRHEEHPTADQCLGAQPGLLPIRHGLVCVLPHRGTRHAGPPHHEHPGNPADPVAGGVGHRGLRRPLRQRDHQPAAADALVPETDGELRDQLGPRRGPSLRAALRRDANLRGRSNAVLRADLPEAQVLHQVRRRGHVRAVVGLHGGHRAVCRAQGQAVEQAAKGAAPSGGS